jgi:hypothetical protein
MAGFLHLTDIFGMGWSHSRLAKAPSNSVLGANGWWTGSIPVGFCRLQESSSKLYPSEFQRWSGVVELSCIILIYIFLIISNCNCIFFYVCVCFLCALDVLFSFIPQWRAQGINAILPDWRPISAIGVERIPPRCEAKRNSARQRTKSILHVLLRIDLI